MVRRTNVVGGVAVAFLGASVCLADPGARGSSGEMPSFKVNLEGLSAPTRYAPAPVASGALSGSPAAEPLLVPLPPGVWATMSGLTGLAIVAMWRKHRLREE